MSNQSRSSLEENASEVSRAQARYTAAARELREAERSAVLSLRNRNVIGDSVLRELERELDLMDVRYTP
jgi:hypothetical protein